jgi:hypothetical protein
MYGITGFWFERNLCTASIKNSEKISKNSHSDQEKAGLIDL